MCGSGFLASREAGPLTPPTVRHPQGASATSSPGPAWASLPAEPPGGPSTPRQPRASTCLFSQTHGVTFSHHKTVASCPHRHFSISSNLLSDPVSVRGLTPGRRGISACLRPAPAPDQAPFGPTSSPAWPSGSQSPAPPALALVGVESCPAPVSGTVGRLRSHPCDELRQVLCLGLHRKSVINCGAFGQTSM